METLTWINNCPLRRYNAGEKKGGLKFLLYSIPFLLGVALTLAAAPAHASPITYQWVCDAPTATCDGDTGFSLQITLDSSVVAPNTVYTATAASHAGFLGWTATSTNASGSDCSWAGTTYSCSTYDGFTMSGDWSTLASVDTNGGLQFHFDANGVLTGLTGISEGIPGQTGGYIWQFGTDSNPDGIIQMQEIYSGSTLTGNFISFRRDQDPAGTGVPSRLQDDTDIYGHFERAQVPEPSALLLLGVGLIALAAWGRRKTVRRH